MQLERKKPRVTRVWTGCLTCKRRKVKCPEERPHCSRCIKGGFTCAGYAVPKAWLFKTSAEIRAEAERLRTNKSSTSSAVNLGAITLSSRQNGSQTIKASPFSLIKLGNSDPFDTYCIRLGPYETSLLQFTADAILPSHPPSAQVYQNWKHTRASDDFRFYAECLENEATGYALLARNAVAGVLVQKGRVADLPTSVLHYMTRAQASLRRTLLLMDSSPTPRTLLNILWAAGFLAAAEVAFGSPAVDLHVGAMNRIVVHYVEIAGPSFRIRDIMHLLFTDIMKSVITFKPCQVDTKVWLPRVLEGVWITAGASPSFLEGTRSEYRLHQSIRDTELRNVMLSQKSRHEVYRRLRASTKLTDMGSVYDAIHAEELLHFGQLGNLAFNAWNGLENPKLTSGQIQDQRARVYLPIAVHLWIRLTSPTCYANNAVMDTAPILLRYLKTAIARSDSDSGSDLVAEVMYAAARLWTLSVAVYTENQCKNALGCDPICGTWFHESFREQAEFMQIRSWQDAVAVFEEFLYSDYVKPHISEWWPQVFPDEANVDQAEANIPMSSVPRYRGPHVPW